MTVQQILYIHGGTTFRTEEEYRANLGTKEISLERLRATRDWKDNLQAVLGPAFDVLAPRMPNGSNAHYAEWELWFSRILPLLDDDVILIGHSLGGVFLARYLAEHNAPIRIKATMLVAAPYGELPDEYLDGFLAPASFERFEKQAGKIFIYHSTDDPVVPYAHVEQYIAALPTALVRTETGMGHFNTPSFPQLETDLRALAL